MATLLRSLLHFVVVISVTLYSAATCRADLVLVDGTFDGTLNDFSTISSSTAATTGVWFTATSFEQADLGSETNTLLRENTGVGAPNGNRFHVLSYQFLDASTASGEYQLDFDYFNNRGSGAANFSSTAYATVYGITGSPWTTSSGFESGVFQNSASVTSTAPAPVLSGATVSTLGLFSTTTQENEWNTEQMSFNLGSGGFDTVVIELGSRFDSFNSTQTAFDNIALNATGVPEPSTALTFAAFGLVATGFRRRRSQRV